MGRFAVPVFFLTSGYLFSIKIENREGFSYAAKYFKRLIKYYLIGSGLFLFFTLIAIAFNGFIGLDIISSLVEVSLLGLHGLINFFYLGKSVVLHLWFLTALAISVELVYVSHLYRRTLELFTAGLGLHLFAVLSNAYNFLDIISVPKQDALFFGLVLTSAGFVLRKKISFPNQRCSTSEQPYYSGCCTF